MVLFFLYPHISSVLILISLLDCSSTFTSSGVCRLYLNGIGLPHMYISCPRDFYSYDLATPFGCLCSGPILDRLTLDNFFFFFMLVHCLGFYYFENAGPTCIWRRPKFPISWFQSGKTNSLFLLRTWVSGRTFRFPFVDGQLGPGSTSKSSLNARPVGLLTPAPTACLSVPGPFEGYTPSATAVYIPTPRESPFLAFETCILF